MRTAQACKVTACGKSSERARRVAHVEHAAGTEHERRQTLALHVTPREPASQQVTVLIL